MFLYFDTDHFNRSGEYHVFDSYGNLYTFNDLLETKYFIDKYYENASETVFSYHMQQMHKLSDQL